MVAVIAARESVLVSLGSNIDPERNLPLAIEVLAGRLTVVTASRVFATDPVAERTIPKFLNAAIEIATDLDPAVLKYEVLREVEAGLGRRRSSDRNAPREIDIDIALFGERVIEDRDLGIEIPDPDILRFAHVALPLADLAPERLHPQTGTSLAEIAARWSEPCGVGLAPNPGVLIEQIRPLPPTR